MKIIKIAQHHVHTTMMTILWSWVGLTKITQIPGTFHTGTITIFKVIGSKVKVTQ